MGVFCKSCSSLMVALKGPAEGRPAEGRPDEGRGSRKAEVLEMADNGVFRETAEGREVAERSSDADGGILGKFAVRGVDTRSVGRFDMVGNRYVREPQTLWWQLTQAGVVERQVRQPGGRKREEQAVWDVGLPMII